MSKLSLIINGNTLELEGENDFIESHLDLIEKIENAKPVIPKPRFENQPNTGDQPESDKLSQNLTEKYPFVYHIDGDTINILSQPSETTKSKKTRSLALLYLFAKKEVSGVASASSNELRELAENFGCLDSKNFASSLVDASPNITIGGAKGGNKTYKLTVPGEDKAQKLALELNDGNVKK